MSTGRGRGNRRSQYGAWAGGADPLAPPYDVRAAVDELGRDVLSGRSVREALRDLLRRGGPRGEREAQDGRDRRGLDDLRERIARRREQLRSSGDLAGSLQQAREKLAAVLEAERAELSVRDDEAARAAETQLDHLPRRTAQAVRELADYDWASSAARQMYSELLSDLRDQALRAQLPGLDGAGQRGRSGEGGAGEGADGTSMDAVKELLGDLNALLAKHARGEDVTDDFAQFMAKHGDAFPEQPADVEELLDALAQRSAAAQRLLRSLGKEQRAELAGLIAAAMEDADLAAEMSALSSHLTDLRPGAFGGGRERFTGSEPLAMDEAVGALAELGELDDLTDALDLDRPGSTLDDVDVEAVERQLGPGAASQLRQLAELERELRRQGWLSGGARSDLQLSPKALRRLGQSALARVFSDLAGHRERGSHEENSAGNAGEAIGTWREWSFGDEQPVDAVATVRRAVLRDAATRPRASGIPAADPHAVRLLPEDFAVAETEHRAGAAVALCVDLSWSMYAEDRWAPMKQTALALAHLIATRYPQDALEIVGFDRVARSLSTSELAGAEPSWVQGTNLQHALALARRHTTRHPSSEPIVLVVTDGEPTAHLEDDGEAVFDWPTSPETLRRTLVEVDAMTRSHIAINTFLLGDDPGLRRFADALARRNGGRVFAPSTQRLGEYVVADYLRTRAAASRSSRRSA